MRNPHSARVLSANPIGMQTASVHPLAKSAKTTSREK